MLISFVWIFSNAEYLIALVDFIYSSRGRLERDRGFANPLSLSNTSPDPWGIRCGGAYLLPRAYRDIDSLYPVQVAHRHFDVVFGCFVFGLGLFAFQKISLGFGLSFFIIGRMNCSFLRLRSVLPCSIVGITADRAIVPILLGASPFHQICRVQKCCKTAFVRLKLHKNGYPVQ